MSPQGQKIKGILVDFFRKGTEGDYLTALTEACIELIEMMPEDKPKEPGYWEGDKYIIPGTRWVCSNGATAWREPDLEIEDDNISDQWKEDHGADV